MPNYPYQCDKCSHEFEVFQRITEEPLTRCPQPDCNGSVHRQIVPGAGFILKGTGFYSTDYRSADYKKSSDSDKASTPTTPPSAPTPPKADSKAS